METVTRSFGAHNPWYRLVRSLIAMIGVIVAIGHIPGWDSDAAVWLHPAEAAFEWLGVAVAGLSGLITSEKPAKQ